MRVEDERERVIAILKDLGYSLKDTFNMDETGLFYRYVL
jgi:hypothetical protein